MTQTINSNKVVHIIAYGDSVTRGDTVGGANENHLAYHQRLKQILTPRWPNLSFTVTNAGVGGQTATTALCRLQQDVIDPQPDFVFVGFALNDSLAELDGLSQYRQSMTHIIEQIQSKTSAGIALLTPNWMCTRPSDTVAEHQTQLIPKFVHVQNDGILATYAQTVRDLAQQYDLGLVDVYQAWQEMADSGKDTTSLLCNGLNHPFAHMHELVTILCLPVIELRI